MSTEIWVAIITSVCSLLGVIITVEVSNKKQAKKNKDDSEKKSEDIKEGLKCLLRSKMLETYYKRQKSKQIRQFELENFIHLYESYKALGGNSFIDEVHEEVMKWKINS